MSKEFSSFGEIQPEDLEPEKAKKTEESVNQISEEADWDYKKWDDWKKEQEGVAEKPKPIKIKIANIKAKTFALQATASDLKKLEKEKEEAFKELEAFQSEDIFTIDIFGDRSFKYDFSLEDLKNDYFVLEKAKERGDLPDDSEDFEKALLEIKDLEEAKKTLLENSDQEKVQETLEEVNSLLQEVLERPELESFIAEYRDKLGGEFIDARQKIINKVIEKQESTIKKLDASRNNFMELVYKSDNPELIEKVEELERQERKLEDLATIDQTLEKVLELKKLTEKMLDTQDGVIDRILKVLEADKEHNLDVEEVEYLINRGEFGADRRTTATIREAIARHINSNFLQDRSQFLPWRNSGKNKTTFRYIDAFRECEEFEGEVPTVEELTSTRDKEGLPEEYVNKIDQILKERQAVTEVLDKGGSLIKILQVESLKNKPGTNPRNNIYLAFDGNDGLTPKQIEQKKAENKKAAKRVETEKKNKEKEKEEQQKRREESFKSESERLKEDNFLIASFGPNVTFALDIQKHEVKNGPNKGRVKYYVSKIYRMDDRDLSIKAPIKIDSQISVGKVVSKEDLTGFGFSGEDIDRAVEVDKAVE